MGTDELLAKLAALHKQATTERSHFYVGSLCQEAIVEIVRLRERISYMGAVCDSVHEIADAALKGE